MVNIAKRGKKGLVAHCLCDYNAAFAGRARRLGVAADAGLIFGQVKKRKGCVGGGFGVAAQASERWRARSARRCGARACAWRLDGAKARSGGAGAVEAGPGAGLEPVAFERLPGRSGGSRGSLGGDPFGPALCSDAVEPDARRLQVAGAAGGEAESLILAQNERWRRA